MRKEALLGLHLWNFIVRQLVLTACIVCCSTAVAQTQQEPVGADSGFENATFPASIHLQGSITRHGVTTLLLSIDGKAIFLRQGQPVRFNLVSGNSQAIASQLMRQSKTAKAGRSGRGDWVEIEISEIDSFGLAELQISGHWSISVAIGSPYVPK